MRNLDALSGVSFVTAAGWGLDDGQPGGPEPSIPPGGQLLNEPRPGDVLDGRFKILKVINRGGMAWIYEAFDQQTGRTVAVKIPLLHCECDAGFYSRFEREEMIGLTLDHPYIVKFVSCGTQKSRPYIVMEYIKGKSLASLLRDKSSLLESEAARIGGQICEALDYLHRKGIIHRDLKPENIMLCDKGGIRILDFGIAKSAQARRLTFYGASSAVGTPDYIAPEQVKGKRGDERTDIYSLGAMLYVMTTGVAPFEGDNPYVLMNTRLSADPEPPRQANPHLSLQMEEIILHAMEREPSNRFRSALAMKAELDDYAKVALEGRSKKVRIANFFDPHKPLLRAIAIFLATQLIAFFLLYCYFKKHHSHGRIFNSAAASIAYLPRIFSGHSKGTPSWRSSD